MPSHNDVWVGRARRTPTGRAFFAFSRFPATRSAALPDGTHRVRAMDMRFLDPTASAGWSATRRFAPFVMTIEIAGDGAVRSERLGN